MPQKIVDLTGKRAGKLVGVKVVGSDAYGRAMWLFKCDCGNEVVRQSSIMVQAIKKHKESHCGCSPSLKTHGLTKQHKKMYWVWASMIQRCTNPSSKDFADYGARGITVHPDWRINFASFCDWSLANGYQPGLSIDRIDNSKGYEPSNCRWVTTKDQLRNQRKTVMVTWRGETRPLIEWSEITKINYRTLRQRLFVNKWDVEKAMTLPAIIGRNQSGDPSTV